MTTGITDPEVLRFIEAAEAFYPPNSGERSIDERRRCYEEFCAFFRSASPENVRVASYEIAGVAVRNYVLPETNSLAPFVLYLHGGGFAVGSLESHDDICIELCYQTGLEILAVDYRLAPEHVYPAQLDDVEAVWNSATRAGRTGIVVGDSAGGTLAAAHCIRMRNLGRPMPKAQVLIYPALGGSFDLPSYSEHRSAPLFTTAGIRHAMTVYTGDRDWSVSNDEQLAPLSAQNFCGLPPALIITADVDPIRDDGIEYAARLTAAGVDAVLRNEPQLVHGFIRARHISQRAGASFAAVVRGLREFAGNPRPAGASAL